MPLQCDFHQVGELDEYQCSVCTFTAYTNAMPSRECTGKREVFPERLGKRPKRNNRAKSSSQPADPWATENDYRDTLPVCPHRGAVIQNAVTCKACGLRGQLYDIYACDIHGKCTLGNRRAAGDPPRQACATCDDRPDTSLGE